jgi:hypothetical protein
MEQIEKETDVAYYKKQSQYLYERTEENHEVFIQVSQCPG